MSIHTINGHSPEDIAEMTLTDAVRALEGSSRPTSKTTGRTKAVSLDDVITLPNVFQHRNDPAGEYERERHVKHLRNALSNLPMSHRQLDPILAMEMAGLWVCIDGHHRLQAYEAEGIERVDLRPFHGTVREAIAEAAAGNSKNQLPMSKSERHDAAWRLTVLTDSSKATVARTTGISERQVGYMREAEAAVGRTDEDPAGLSWIEARRIWKGEPVRKRDEDWEYQQIDRYVNLLSKTFGKKLHDHRFLFADALDIFSESTVDAIIERHAEDRRPLIEGVFEEADEEAALGDEGADF